MSEEWKHLSVDAVARIHAQVLAAHGGSDGIRDPGLLESAVAAPQATWGGEPIMTDPLEIAAAYLFYICRNHPFVDGNKRAALASSLVFLEQNGLWNVTKLPVDDWESLVLDVAASRLDRDQTTARLKKLVGARGKKKQKPRKKK
jgi:death-on-curing protein